MINVSNIERFATHDGPGIRTTVFLKGCPLHCPWCANPETWTIDPVLMHDERKCVKCRMCESRCPNQAISFNPDFQIDRKRCIACGTCTETCIPDALSISGKRMKIEDIIKEIDKDKDYYEYSGGGVTISGGEPFFQKEIFELVEAIKSNGYHLAAETTGNYSLEHLKKIEPYIDLFLFDLKHVDSKKIKEVAGANLEMILNNLDYLSKHCPEKVIIRVPVIPTFNYFDDVLKQIIQKTKEFGFKEINLLPYHPLGKNKWHNLKRDYTLEDEKMMEKEVLIDYKNYGEELGLKVKLGG